MKNPNRLVEDNYGSWFVIPDHRIDRWEEFLEKQLKDKRTSFPEFAEDIYLTELRFKEYVLVEEN